jgi:TatD DNase family protein
MYEKYVEHLYLNQDSIVAIGETGLDYNWVKNKDWQKKQKLLFSNLIDLSINLQLPLVIHSRDAVEDTINLLEERSLHRVHMHMLTKHSFLKRILDNAWFISVNTLLLRSKEIRKIVRDCPLEFLMLETDSPWLGLNEEGAIRSKYEVRNEPVSVKLVAQRIAQIKKVTIEEVNQITTRNANKFFNLGLKPQ